MKIVPPNPLSPASNARRRACAALLLAAGSWSVGGCYDGAAMLERVRNDAIRTRLEEVELGEFHVTLPPNGRSNESTEVYLELFGRAVRYRLASIRQRTRENEHVYRQSVLLSIREATDEELADPEFAQLRKRLLDAVNATLGDTPVEAIGFRNVRLVRH